jgi:hypothetical protein
VRVAVRSHAAGRTNDFGRNAGYGALLANPYLVFGGNGASPGDQRLPKRVLAQPMPGVQ